MSAKQSLDAASSGRFVSFAGDVTTEAEREKTRKREAEKAKIALEDEGQRKEFGNNVEALVSCIANAVGLGNVWRFPYICYKSGGGAFFIPYTVMLILAAMPILGLELAWGQFTSVGPVEQWSVYPLLGGTGIAAIWVNVLVMIYYAVLASYALFYIAMSVYSLKDLPDDPSVWNGCDHWWSSPNCLTLANLTWYHKHHTEPLQKSSYSMPTSNFWYGFASMDDGSFRQFGYPNWKLVIALFITWGIVLVSNYRGVRSMGKANYFFGLFPYLCIIFLIFAGSFKEGAAEGILIYLVPKFEKLLELDVWADAAQQIFFSLTCCQGVMVTLSSFNGYHEQCLQNTLTIVVVNCVTSFWIGIPIFAVLGHMAHEMGTSVAEVVEGGPALAFIAYPQALNFLPGAAIWSIIFCSMLFTVAMGSITTNTESSIALVIDSFPVLRKKKKEIAFRAGIMILFFLLGLPMVCERGGMQLLNIDDSFCTGITSFVIGLSMLIVIGWIYGMKNFEQDVALMVGHRPNWYWRVTWKYLTPIVLLFMSVIWILNKAKAHDAEPQWAHTLGWMIALSVLIIIPLYAFFVMCEHPAGISCEAYRALTKPNHKWGPLREENRVGTKYEFLSRSSQPVPVVRMDAESASMQEL